MFVNIVNYVPKVYRMSRMFIKHARKPQGFKLGDEWHPFEAKRRLFPA
jgi:hypothetical protein